MWKIIAEKKINELAKKMDLRLTIVRLTQNQGFSLLITIVIITINLLFTGT